MIASFEATPIVLCIAVLIGMCVVLLGRMILPGLAKRIRILQLFDGTSERERQYEQRVQTLRALLAGVHDMSHAKTDAEVLAAATSAIVEGLDADRCALVTDDECHLASPTPARPLSSADEAAVETLLRERAAKLQGRTDSSIEADEHVLTESLDNHRWLIAARRCDRPPFGKLVTRSLRDAGSVAEDALAHMAHLKSEASARDRTEQAAETMRRAELLVARSEILSAQGELTHHLVRELTGPMTGILGLSQFLGDHTTECKEEIETLLEEAMRCRRILEQFSAVSLGNLGEPGHEVVDAAHIVRELVETMSPRYRDAGVTLDNQLPEGHWLLHTNPATFARIATDLLRAGLAFAQSTAGESAAEESAPDEASSAVVVLRVDEDEDALHLDTLAARPGATPACLPATTPESGEAKTDETELWANLETMNLAVLQATCRCIDGVLDVRQADDVLHLRLRLPTGPTPMPLRSEVLPTYRTLEASPS